MITGNDLKDYFKANHNLDINEDTVRMLEHYANVQNNAPLPQRQQNFIQRLESFKNNKHLYMDLSYRNEFFNRLEISQADIDHVTKFRNSGDYHADRYQSFVSRARVNLVQILYNPHFRLLVNSRRGIFPEASELINDYLSFKIKEDLPEEAISEMDSFRQTVLNVGTEKNIDVFRNLISSSSSEQGLQGAYKQFTNQKMKMEKTKMEMEKTRLKMIDQERALVKPRQGSSIIGQISPDFFKNFFKVSRR